MKKDVWFFGLFLFVFVIILFFSHLFARCLNGVVVGFW